MTDPADLPVPALIDPTAPRDPATGPHGWIVIDKPRGMGSTQVVSAVKRAFRAAGLPVPKVGHGGTLDPLASGVLPIALGEATKLAGRILDATKAYEFLIAFGTETAGLDAEGPVVASHPRRPTRAEVARVLPRFTGVIDQVPPAYSALKVDGRRAHALARAGAAPVLASRRVEVSALAFAGPVAADGFLAVAPLRAVVSKGTYIRSLARDIARSAGSVGFVADLRRTMAGPFTLAQAVGLDRLGEIGQGAQLDYLLPMQAGLADIPALSCTPAMAAAIRQGRVLDGGAAGDGLAEGLVWAQDEKARPLALLRHAAGRLTVERGFNC